MSNTEFKWTLSDFIGEDNNDIFNSIKVIRNKIAELYQSEKEQGNNPTTIMCLKSKLNSISTVSYDNDDLEMITTPENVFVSETMKNDTKNDDLSKLSIRVILLNSKKEIEQYQEYPSYLNAEIESKSPSLSDHGYRGFCSTARGAI